MRSKAGLAVVIAAFALGIFTASAGSATPDHGTLTPDASGKGP